MCKNQQYVTQLVLKVRFDLFRKCLPPQLNSFVTSNTRIYGVIKSYSRLTLYIHTCAFSTTIYMYLCVFICKKNLRDQNLYCKNLFIRCSNAGSLVTSYVFVHFVNYKLAQIRTISEVALAAIQTGCRT